ncbi:GntR family transcriptional regulator [Polaribacter batillariae]|uniref:GntR family transcriptional regulator n=1 Tax=Polaribacter batillariae TaxID=2808900 RepID=A0ABX7T0Y0_9FLAO|nr:GntR family transcriptional regulator [Polaribacter batillariae]QTD39168.1 GntR family transcriptional regulator [Polaribacter batillariae]
METYKHKISLTIDHESDIPKYQQLVNEINNAIAENILKKGDAIPSVNKTCKSCKVSRDTVFKAYSILSENGTINAVPNKGYYVANDTKKVLLVLDTFKAYKEVLYHSFVNNLPNTIITDVQFHHYNINNFKIILNNSKGKYYKYIVMPFQNEEVPAILSDIDNNKLLLVDWNIHSNKTNNYVFQDFGKSFYEGLKEAVQLFRKYKKLVFLYPTYTYHPKESITYFKKFCKEYQFNYKIITNPRLFSAEENVAYISTSDRMLGVFLEQCKVKNLEPGTNVGFLSYNETPMKKFIYKGISVISTDFKKLGLKAAEFVLTNQPMQYYVPTKLILRASL